MDNLDARKRREDEESQRLGVQAQAAGNTALSKTTIAAATSIIARVQPDKGRGAIAEPAEDLHDIRSDSILRMTLRRDCELAEQTAFVFIRDALILGYRTEAELTSLPGAHITVTLSDEDRRELSGYPILGLSAGEQAADLAWKLRTDANRALGQTLTAQSDPTKIPSALGAVSAAHGARLGLAVTEAYYAGTQCASIELGQALKSAIESAPNPCPDCGADMGRTSGEGYCQACEVVQGHQIIIADVPYGAGTSRDGQVVYIDRRVPNFLVINGITVDTWESVATHELFEKPLLDAGEKYQTAHPKAEAHEEAFVLKKYGISGKDYDAALDPYVARALKMATDKTKIPADLEPAPYRDCGEMALIEGASGQYRLGV